jgi:rhodanese-related sulfurtransferase
MYRTALIRYPHQELDDGDVITLGRVRLTVMHTPGHSMDSISLLVHDDASDEPDQLLSGDTLFVGEVGRPDLHGDGAIALAEALYTSLHSRVLQLDDQTVVYPGHLAGSLCGKNIAPDPSTTIGREKQRNPSLAAQDQSSFVRLMVTDLPPRPPNVAHIVELNRSGAPTSRPTVTSITPAEVTQVLRTGLPVDGRDYSVYAHGHLQGAINIPVGYGQFGLMLAWLFSRETPLLLMTTDEEDLTDAIDSMMTVGMTNPIYALSGDEAEWRAAGLPIVSLPLATPAELASRLAAGAIGSVVDVREPTELGSGLIEGAINIPYRQLRELSAWPRLAEPVVAVCNSGNRSTLAASMLARYGVPVLNLAGGTTAWQEANLPLVAPATAS